MKPGLGTQLRHLIELLDGAVEAAYDEAGLNYRPRFTPVMRSLVEREPLTLGEIASRAGISQPAATQTVSLMLKEGLVVTEPGPRDGRQKLVRLSEQGRALLPELRRCWQATRSAAGSLDADMPYPLSQALDDAIRALSEKPFGARIRDARMQAAGDGESARESQ